MCESDKTTTVLVRSGKVKFFPNATTQSPVLTANQKAVFDLASNTLRVSNAVSLNELAWQTGGLEFVKTPLSQVILDLEKYYHVKNRVAQSKPGQLSPQRVAHESVLGKCPGRLVRRNVSEVAKSDKTCGRASN